MDVLAYTHPIFRDKFTANDTFENLMICEKRREENIATFVRTPNLKIEQKLYGYKNPIIMSISDVYGIKIPYSDLRKIMKKNYKTRVENTWEKYILCDMVEMLSEDMKIKYPGYKFDLHTTGWCDEAGVDTVLGIQLNHAYVSLEIPDYNDPEKLYIRIREYIFSNWNGGHAIHLIPYIFRKDQKILDEIIKYVKILIDDEDFGKLPPKYYKVENCAC